MKLFILIIIAFSSIQSQQVLDEILAIVGNEIVTKSEVDQALLQLKIQQRLSDEQLLQQRPLILKQMVDEKLLYIKSQLDSVEVSEEQLTQEANARWKQLVRQVANYGGESYLEQVYNEKVRNIKKRQRKKLRRDLSIMQLRSKYFQDIHVSRDEVYQFFKNYKDSLPVQPERVEIANIVKKVKPKKEASTLAYENAKKAIERLEKGADFAALAKELSQGPSASNGGYLGKVSKGEFVKEYDDAARLLAIGTYSSEPVKSPFGYHVIKLHSKSGDVIETSHILFMARVTEEDIQAANTFLDSLRDEIISGNISFEDAAVKYSDDPSSKDRKGNLGIFPIESMPNQQTKAALQLLSDGELSKSFKVDDQNVQIVKLIKRYKASEYDVNRDFSAIESMALRFKQTKRFEALLAELKEEIPIELH